MSKKIDLPTPAQRRAAAARKLRQAKRLAQKAPQASGVVATIVPPTARMRRQKIGLLRHALEVEKATGTAQSLESAKRSLLSAIAKSRYRRDIKRSATVGTVDLSSEEIEKTGLQLRNYLASLQQAIPAAQEARSLAETPEAKRAASTQLSVLAATIAGVEYRLRLLSRGKGVISDTLIARNRLKHHLPPIDLPMIYAPPTREDAALAVRIIGARRPRRRGETSATYRGVLRAYTKRALLRKVSRKGSTILDAVNLTFAADAPSIEEAAAKGGVPEDDLSNLADAAVQDAAEEIEEAVVDFDEQDVAAGQSVEEAVEEAVEEEAALAAEGEEEGDELAVAAVSAEPFWKKKEFILGVLAVAGFTFLMQRR